MAIDYTSYLAAGVLSDGRVITYRLLSRALKVHVNTAKEMLFEFHRIQNGKKPGTVHATYLLSGTKRPIEPTVANGHHIQEDGDTHMPSSPVMSSSMPQAEESQVQSIILAREEHLEVRQEVRGLFEKISSIHIYSLQPHPLKDLHILSDATREILELTAAEDPQEYSKTYGTIQNKNVRRRKGRAPPPAVVPAPAPIVKAKPTTSSQKQGDKLSEENKPKSIASKQDKIPEKVSSQSSAAKDFFAKKDADKKAAASSADQKSSSKTSKQPKSNIFASFAKAKPKLKKEGTDSSAVASGVESVASAQPSEVEDSPMKDVSDDDDEDDGYVPPVAPPKENVDKDRKARKEREAALRQMMEEEDDEEEVPTPTAEPDEPLDAMQIDKPEEPVVVVEGGRRRGRRRVMKKKTIKDEEGYLVTKEEPVWESFSEDEPVAKPKPKPAFSSSAGSGKSKKTAGKPGQGNIMSFFGKK